MSLHLRSIYFFKPPSWVCHFASLIWLGLYRPNLNLAAIQWLARDLTSHCFQPLANRNVRMPRLPLLFFLKISLWRWLFIFSFSMGTSSFMYKATHPVRYSREDTVMNYGHQTEEIVAVELIFPFSPSMCRLLKPYFSLSSNELWACNHF